MKVVDAQRQGEVALVLLKEVFREKIGVRIVPPSEFKRVLGNLSKKTKIPAQEIQSVIEPMYRELIDEMFAKG